MELLVFVAAVASSVSLSLLAADVMLKLLIAGMERDIVDEAIATPQPQGSL